MSKVIRTWPDAYAYCARRLRRKGWRGVRIDMISEVHDAISDGDAELPHGALGIAAGCELADGGWHGLSAS